MVAISQAARLAFPSVTAAFHSCDWNRYNIRYALALSQQRGLKRPSEPAGSEEDIEEDEDRLCLLRTADGDVGDELLV